MRSPPLHGKVRHALPAERLRLEHDVYYFALDLAELDAVDRSAAPFGRNRRRCPLFHDGDHCRRRRRTCARRPRAPARAGHRPGGLAHHPRRQPARPRLRVQPGQLLPVPRWPRARCGRRRRGPQHARRAPPVHARRSAGQRLLASMDKEFYVSPFIDMDGRYTVRVQRRARRPAHRHRERGGWRAAAATSLVCSGAADRPQRWRRMLMRYPARRPTRRSRPSTGTPCGCGCAACPSIATRPRRRVGAATDDAARSLPMTAGRRSLDELADGRSSRAPSASSLAAGRAHPGRPPHRGAAGRHAARLRRPGHGPPRRDPHPRPDGAAAHPLRRRARRRRSLHGRSLAQPRPRRRCSAGRSQPRGARR